MPRVGRPPSVRRQRIVNAVPEMTDVDSDEVMTLEDKAEVEEILADMLFDFWKKKRGIR